MRAAVLHAPRDLRIVESKASSLGVGQVKVHIGAGGICGSDLHYYLHGGFGPVRLQEPMILGHEIAGVVAELGPEVTSVSVGDKVAVNPSQPGERCRFCRMGMQNQCLDILFYGSAMRMPHVQGGFRDELVCNAAQVVLVPEHVSINAAAFAEPLAVCLHAISRAGPLVGRRVLVTGAGPIGALMVAAVRRAGAAEIIATDVLDAPLRIVRQVGADRTINVASEPEALRAYEGEKGQIDVMFEASGAPSALRSGLAVVRPRGVIVQIGQGGEASLALSALVGREIELRGTFRFHEEFATAVHFITSGLIDVEPLLTCVMPLEEATEAFELAADKSRSMKVQLAFG